VFPLRRVFIRFAFYALRTGSGEGSSYCCYSSYPMPPEGCMAIHRRYRRVPKCSPNGKRHVHALKGLACRKRVAAASSPAATCKHGAALTSPARHACGCARPSRARLCHRSIEICVRWVQSCGTPLLLTIQRAFNVCACVKDLILVGR
jgi:hypothetical protein